jgi:hypothetical protein
MDEFSSLSFQKGNLVRIERQDGLWKIHYVSQIVARAICYQVDEFGTRTGGCVDAPVKHLTLVENGTP